MSSPRHAAGEMLEVMFAAHARDLRAALFRELQRLGYRGSYPTLARYLRRLQAARGDTALLAASAQPRPALVAASPRRVLTPRTVTWLVLRRAERRSAEDRALLADLRRHAPELDEAVALTEAFTGLIRDHAPDRLDPGWRGRQTAPPGSCAASRNACRPTTTRCVRQCHTNSG